ncbi:MAG: hypothetical protein WKG01_05580 [Kofleriaceae bacterium]
MFRSLVILASVAAPLPALATLVGACRSDGQPAIPLTAEPATVAPVAQPPAPTQSTDLVGAMPMRPISFPASADPARHQRERNADPTYKLAELGPHRYRGRVADQCPSGSAVVKPEVGWSLIAGALEISLPAGGCPTWIGYTVVAADRNLLSESARDRIAPTALPFYVCADPWHDVCESMGENTWVFDVASLISASRASEAVFAPPTPVDSKPGALCCCSVNNSLAVTTYPTCEVRGGVCDVEAECYGITGPVP